MSKDELIKDASIKAISRDGSATIQIDGPATSAITLLEKSIQAIHDSLNAKQQDHFIEFLETTINELKGDN